MIFVLPAINASCLTCNAVLFVIFVLPDIIGYDITSYDIKAVTPPRAEMAMVVSFRFIFK